MTNTDPLLSIPADMKSVADEMCSLIVGEISGYWQKYSENCLVSIPEDNLEQYDDSYQLILINDDIHTFEDVRNGLQLIGVNNSERMIREVHENGSSVIFEGVALDEVNNKAVTLRDHCHLNVCVLPKLWNMREKAIISSIHWMQKVASNSDGMCRIICNQFSPETLLPILKADCYLPKHLAGDLHNLFIAVMADNTFKMKLASCYADSYLKIAELYSRGIGTVECSLFSLSVQFLNRESYGNSLEGLIVFY